MKAYRLAATEGTQKRVNRETRVVLMKQLLAFNRLRFLATPASVGHPSSVR